MLDVTGLLESIKAEPFTEMPVRAPHTGVISFSGVREGDKVMGPCGEWKEVPGTRIATITRERNPKPVAAGLDPVSVSVSGMLLCRYLDGNRRNASLSFPR